MPSGDGLILVYISASSHFCIFPFKLIKYRSDVTNCSKLNNAQIDLIGITHGDTRNQRAGKHKQADALHLYYSISAKDQKRVKYELKKYNVPQKSFSPPPKKK